MKMPKVSVLMPIYRTNTDHLREAINSILSQTYRDFEFLILDDCPTDSRIDVVNSFDDPRIIYIQNKQNLGISGARNKLLSLAKGEYIAIFDHDDISLPNRLEKQVNYLNAHPKVGVVSANKKYIHSGITTKYPEKNIDIKDNLIFGCIVVHTASMIRKSILVDNNIGWEATYSPAEDYMLWARLLDKTMFYNIQDTLVLYRDHPQNTSNIQSEEMLDRDWLIKQFIATHYPRHFVKRYEWIYMFGLIPLFQIRETPKQKQYRLFGILPVFTEKR